MLPIEADPGATSDANKNQNVDDPEAEYYATALKAQGDGG